jgi:hypothetical protein
MFDYRKNSDYYQNAYIQATPRNAVIDVLFSDQMPVSTPGGGESVLTLSAAGGEYSLIDNRLLGADIVLLFRDGLNYYETQSSFTGNDKEFQFDAVTGTIIFPPAPFPSLQPNEKVTMTFIAGGSEVLVTEPVMLTQAKAWLKVTFTDEDDLITALITAARQVCESYTAKSFVERTVTAVLRNDLGNVKLPYGPVGNVTGAADVDGNSITDFVVTGVFDKRLCSPISSYVQISYTAGYSVLPQQFQTALQMQLSWMYLHRGDEELTNIAPDAKAILSPFRAVV